MTTYIHTKNDYIHICVCLQPALYAGALFVNQALRWNMYLAIILLLAVAALFTICGKPRVGWLVVFYVPSTARSFRDGIPHLLSLAQDEKLGKYTVPTGNRTPGRRVVVHYSTAAQRQLRNQLRALHKAVMSYYVAGYL